MNMKAAAFSLVSCLPMTGWAQPGRQEKTINLPPGVSVEYGTISRASTQVAAVGSDNVVRVWSTNSGELLQSLTEHGHPPTGVAFSADGYLLAVAYQLVPNEKGVLKVYDVTTWKVEHELALPFDMFALAFSPDDRRLALSDLVAHTQIWDLATSSSLTDISPPFGGSASLSFSEDGKWIATADDDAHVRVYYANSGKLRSTADGFLVEPWAVAFSRDGKSVIAGGADYTVSLLDLRLARYCAPFPSNPD
jgi:WD40 repeat protein